MKRSALACIIVVLALAAGGYARANGVTGATGPGASPSPTPSPGPCPDPTPSPDPTPTPSPDPTPSPEPCPDPSPSPNPTQSPEPSPDFTPSPDPSPPPELSPEVFHNVPSASPSPSLDPVGTSASPPPSSTTPPPSSLSPAPMPSPIDESSPPRVDSNGYEGSELPYLEGPFTSYRLVQVAAQLRALGWSEDRVRKQVYTPFIVAGRAAWVDTWGAPRYGPGSIVRSHEGQDVFCDYGAPVLASEDGIVEYGIDVLGGRVARLLRPDGSHWYYAHLSDWNTEEFSSGDRVESGDIIGFCGNTGNARWSHPHVHFGLYQPDGTATDPMPMLVEWLHTAEHRSLSLLPRVAGTPDVTRTWRTFPSDILVDPFNDDGPLAWALQSSSIPATVDANLTEPIGDPGYASPVLVGILVTLLYTGLAPALPDRNRRRLSTEHLGRPIPGSWPRSSTSRTSKEGQRIPLLDQPIERDGGAALTQDDAIYRFRLRALALATELGNVRAACRAMGIHPSTFYRWRAQVLRFGPESLRPRERRRPKGPSQNDIDDR